VSLWFRHAKQIALDIQAADGAAKILVKREKCVRLQLAEDAAELLLDAVNFVEEAAPVHLKATAAELPVGPQQEMKAEYSVLGFIQTSFCDPAEISHVFFVFHSPNLPGIPTVNLFQTHP
jgi:hypothetical protein